MDKWNGRSRRPITLNKYLYGNADPINRRDLNTPEGQATFRENRLGERCAKYTGKTVEIAARIVSEANDKSHFD
jgi:hypothetical protein